MGVQMVRSSGDPQNVEHEKALHVTSIVILYLVRDIRNTLIFIKVGISDVSGYKMR